MKRFSSLFSAVVLGIAVLTAQNTVDIGLFHNGNGQLEVKVRPQADFDGIFSSVVFTIRWDRSTGATMGDPVQLDEAAQYMPIARSGAVHEHGTYNYQVFAGFGFQRIANSGLSWEAGNEYTILTIPVQGAAAFELLNDSWTGELEHNADYYTSLGGEDRTGDIYRSLAVSGDLENTVNILPNPNDGLFTFTFVVTQTSDVRVEVLSTLGQSVLNELLPSFQGTYSREMDLTSMSNGIYYLKISRGNDISVHKIVYR